MVFGRLKLIFRGTNFYGAKIVNREYIWRATMPRKYLAGNYAGAATAKKFVCLFVCLFVYLEKNHIHRNTQWLYAHR